MLINYSSLTLLELHVGDYFKFLSKSSCEYRNISGLLLKRLVDVVLVLGVSNSTVRTNSNWEQVFELMCPSKP